MSSFVSRQRIVLRKLAQLNWALIGLASLLGMTGVAMMYSVGGGNLQPWATGHFWRLLIGIGVLLLVAIIDIRRWFAAAYVLYGLLMVLLISLEFMSPGGNGVQRWIRIGGISLQPSELIRFGLLLALARYFHMSDASPSNIWRLLIPLTLITVPLIFIMRQPDLGTAVLLALTGGAVIFAAGLSWKYIGGAALGLVAATPLLWSQLRDYQRGRILGFLDPERDPLGAGYHILQSKIAIGSGGLTGRGYMRGSQSQLDFLPEQRTDFIFTMFAEEMGFLGSMALLLAYGGLLGYSLMVAVQTRAVFGRLLACGIGFAIFAYVFVNMAMVMGLVPVVGMPLPLISYGGSAMLTMMASLGLLLSIQAGRGYELGK